MTKAFSLNLVKILILVGQNDIITIERLLRGGRIEGVRRALTGVFILFSCYNTGSTQLHYSSTIHLQ